MTLINYIDKSKNKKLNEKQIQEKFLEYIEPKNAEMKKQILKRISTMDLNFSSNL